MQDLLEKLKLDSQEGPPLPGGDLLEKLKLDSGVEPGLEEPEPIPEARELPELYPEPGILDKIQDLAKKLLPGEQTSLEPRKGFSDIPLYPLPKQPKTEYGDVRLPESPVEREQRLKILAEKPKIEAWPEERQRPLVPGKLAGPVAKGGLPYAQPEVEMPAYEPEIDLPRQEKLVKLIQKYTIPGLITAAHPIAGGIFLALGEAKNVLATLKEDKKFSIYRDAGFRDFMPKGTPEGALVVADFLDMGVDIAIAAYGSKKISNKALKSFFQNVRVASKARGDSPKQTAEIKKIFSRIVSEKAEIEGLSAEDAVWLWNKSRSGELNFWLEEVTGGPAIVKRTPDVTRGQPTIPALVGRIKPPVIPELQAAPSMITTEEGVSFRPGTETEPELTLARYRAAERGMPETVVPETQVTIDVTPKPGGGQTITIKSPERPVEPRTPVEPAPIAPAKAITERKPPEYRDDPLLAAVAEIGGIKADQDYKHADLKKLLPFNLIKAAKGKVGQFMDEAAQEISGLHPELKIEDAESLKAALEVRRYEEKKPLTEKEEQLGAEEHYREQARIFKENERNLAGILYENEWINNRTSMLYTDEVKEDLEGVIGQEVSPDYSIEREGGKYVYKFRVSDNGKTLFIERAKLKEPEQKALKIEKPKGKEVTDLEKAMREALDPVYEGRKPAGSIYGDNYENNLDYFEVEKIIPKIKQTAKIAGKEVHISDYDNRLGKNLNIYVYDPNKTRIILRKNNIDKGPEEFFEFADDVSFQKGTPEKKAIDEIYRIKEVKPRVPEFGETKPVQMGLDTEESGKLEFEKKKEVVPEKGKELTPEEKKALGEKYEDLGKTEGAKEEKPLPEAEKKEIIPEKMKMVNISIRDPNGEMFDMGRIPVSKLKNIRAVARRYGVANRLKIGEPFTGKWKEFYSPTEHETFINETIRDVKEVPAAEWKKWEMFSGYPITSEAKRALKTISEKRGRRKKIALDELKKELVKTDKGKVEWMFIETEMKLKDKRKPTFRKAYRAAKRAIVDTGGNVKTDIMKNLGDLGKEAAVRHDLMAGAGPAGNRLSKVAEKEIYKGLSKSEEELLNRAIYLRRQLAISKYREELTPEKEAGLEEELVLTGEEKKYIRHPHGLTKKEHQPYFEDEIPDHINKKADIFFKQMEGVLDEYLKEGLITKKSHENMKNKGDYSPRWYIQYLDPEPTYTKIVKNPDSGIRALDEGSYEVMEYDSRLFIQSVVGRATGRIFRNRANKAAYKIAEEIPDNGIFIKAKKGKKTPGGHTSIKAMIEGKAEEIWMPDEFAKEWVKQDPLIGDVAANIIGWLSGSKILKAMATGLNPGFIVTNMPRDIGLIFIASDEYSSFLPKYAFQMASDLRAVKKDAFLRKGEFIDYVDEGGMMSFLTLQGKPFKTANKAIEGAQEVLGYVGNTSEIWTRLALRRRGLINELEPYEATREARNYLDFYKHGSVVQVLDKGFPYLNAGIQATRGIFRAVIDRPIQTMWKFAQLGALAAGLYMAGRYVCKECLDAITDREKVNNFIIPTPFSIKDKSGNERYIYFKIAKDQGQRVVCTIFENMMAKYLGDEVDADQITSAVQDFLPIMPTNKIPPSFDAFFGYVANRDFWTNEDIWKSGKVDPVSEEYTPYTHPAVVKLGKAFHLSPERLDYALAQFFTRGNIYTSLVSGGLNLTMQGMDEKDKRRTSAEIIQSLPFARRVFRLTPPYSEKAMKEQEEAKVEENTRRYKQKRELSEMSNTFYRKLYDDKTKDRDLLFKIRGFIKDQPTEDRARLALWFRNYGRIYDIPERVWWLNLSEMSPEARAHVFWNKYLESDEDEQKEMLQLIKKIPGVSSDRFYARLKTLRAKWRKLQ